MSIIIIPSDKCFLNWAFRAEIVSLVLVSYKTFYLNHTHNKIIFARKGRCRISISNSGVLRTITEFFFHIEKSRFESRKINLISFYKFCDFFQVIKTCGFILDELRKIQCSNCKIFIKRIRVTLWKIKLIHKGKLEGSGKNRIP